MEPEFHLPANKVLSVLQDYNLVVSYGSAIESSDTLALTTKIDELEKGGLYLAYKGVRFDLHNNISRAMAKGAALVVLEDEAYVPTDATSYIVVKNSRKAWALLASAGYGFPQRSLTMIGVTGTNGKSSTVWILGHLLKSAGCQGLVLGTLGAYIGETLVPTLHTTPDPPELFRLLAIAVDAGCSFAAMEISSIAVHQNKVDFIDFAIGGFTSFSQDHLDAHDSMESYLSCKMEFFDKVGIKFHHNQLDLKTYGGNLPGDSCSYGKAPASPGVGYAWERGAEGKSRLTISFPGNRVESGLFEFGFEFGAANFCLAVLLAEAFWGANLDSTLWKDVPSVPGRMEFVDDCGLVVVDYAHTPDALSSVLATCKSISSRVWVVVGCGGDRDRSKRPKMAKVAYDLADHVVFTSDNPRYEDPQSILVHMVAGLQGKAKVVEIVDRAEAIHYALENRQKGELVLIAGKGHERYQEIRGKRHFFSDKEVAQQFLRSRSDRDQGSYR